ncbi:MAG: ABC transporter, partial [Bacteroidota bacterium]
QNTVKVDLSILKNEINKLDFKEGLEDLDIDGLTIENYSPDTDQKLSNYLQKLKKHYQGVYNKIVAAKEQKMFQLGENEGYNLNEYKNTYFNESLADLVQNVAETDRIIEFNGQLIQQYNSIFNDPNPQHLLDYRAHFFAPQKHFAGSYFGTFGFNIIIIWLMTALLYLTLYFELLRKGLDAFGKIKFGKK